MKLNLTDGDTINRGMRYIGHEVRSRAGDQIRPKFSITGFHPLFTITTIVSDMSVPLWAVANRRRAP